MSLGMRRFVPGDRVRLRREILFPDGSVVSAGTIGFMIRQLVSYPPKVQVRFQGWADFHIVLEEDCDEAPR